MEIIGHSDQIQFRPRCLFAAPHELGLHGSRDQYIPMINLTVYSADDFIEHERNGIDDGLLPVVDLIRKVAKGIIYTDKERRKVLNLIVLRSTNQWYPCPSLCSWHRASWIIKAHNSYHQRTRTYQVLYNGAAVQQRSEAKICSVFSTCSLMRSECSGG